MVRLSKSTEKKQLYRDNTKEPISSANSLANARRLTTINHLLRLHYCGLKEAQVLDIQVTF